MRYGQLVMGPAGSGKSTYCSAIVQHAAAANRMIRVVNLDPAAEQFSYTCAADIRELIHVDDAMEDAELHLGPNGGLVFCMEYLTENLDWLEEQLGDSDDEYILFDCPGQIELYTHFPVMRKVVDALQRWNFRICAAFILDTQFMLEVSKFFAGTLTALSCMINLELPTVNVLSKMDLLSKSDQEKVEAFLDPDCRLLSLEDADESGWHQRHRQLSAALGHILDDFSLVRFTPVNIQDEDSMADVLLSIDMCIQYGEDAEVRDRYPEEMEPGGNGLTGDV